MSAISTIETLLQRNETYSESNHFHPELKILPTLKLMILGCVDPRVDPHVLFNLSPGEAAILRNVGGRVTPDILQAMKILSHVSKAGGKAVDEGWNLIVLHHTDCGITKLPETPQPLADYWGISLKELQSKAINDPYAAVAVDVALLKSNPLLPAALTVTGLVYDVKTGKIDVAVPSGPIRPN